MSDAVAVQELERWRAVNPIGRTVAVNIGGGHPEHPYLILLWLRDGPRLCASVNGAGATLAEAVAQALARWAERERTGYRPGEHPAVTRTEVPTS